MENGRYGELSPQNAQNLMNLIDQALNSLAVKIENKGGQYIREILYILLTEKAQTTEIAEPLRRVAHRFGIAAESARSSIRYAIVQAWRMGDPNVQYRYFGRSVEFHRGKPTESAFIATVAMALRHEADAYFSRSKLPDDGIPPEMIF
ncbi:MAG: hypothetical protein E7632_10050, partial [Ruminococcaceae bacterium]|nr:hypothetical protein [Oscillospiraceae bacterium]